MLIRAKNVADLLCLKTGSSYQNIKNDLWAKFMNTVKRAFSRAAFFAVYGVFAFRGLLFSLFAAP